MCAKNRSEAAVSIIRASKQTENWFCDAQSRRVMVHSWLKCSASASTSTRAASSSLNPQLRAVWDARNCSNPAAVLRSQGPTACSTATPCTLACTETRTMSKPVVAGRTIDRVRCRLSIILQKYTGSATAIKRCPWASLLSLAACDTRRHSILSLSTTDADFANASKRNPPS